LRIRYYAGDLSNARAYISKDPPRCRLGLAIFSIVRELHKSGFDLFCCPILIATSYSVLYMTTNLIFSFMQSISEPTP